MPVNTKYKNYSVKDFLKDDLFLQWQLLSTETLDNYWKQVLQENPHQEANITNAIRTLHSIAINRSALSCQKEDEILKNIYARYHRHKIRRFIYWTTSVAAGLILLFFSVSPLTNITEENINVMLSDVQSVRLDTIQDVRLIIGNKKTITMNEDFKDVVNKDGTPLFSQSKDNKKWEKAAVAAKLVIDLPEYDLYKEYLEDGSIDALMSCTNLYLTTTEQNPEIIMAFPGKTSSLYEYHLMPRKSGFAGCISATQNIVDAFFMKNGLSIDELGSGYVEEGFSTEDTYYPTKYTYGSADKKEGLVTPKGTYNMYVNREPRFYANIRFHGKYCSFDDDKRQHNFLNGGQDGKPSHDSPIAGYQINKAIHPATRSGSYPYKPGIIVRLGEMYLNYAEALNEYNPGHTDITKYVNLIRERAGLPALKSGLSQSEMREAIHHERRVEFAFEGGMRYMDIRRWKEAEKVFETPISGMNTDAKTNNDFFKRTEIQKRIFLKKMYLWPIYQTYLDNNEKMVQNKYW